jgi:hypothetical protein
LFAQLYQFGLCKWHDGLAGVRHCFRGKFLVGRGSFLAAIVGFSGCRNNEQSRTIRATDFATSGALVGPEFTTTGLASEFDAHEGFRVRG